MRLAMALACWFGTVAWGGPPPQPAIVWVLEMHAGLDHLGQAGELKEQVRAAKAGGARLVCVEMSGRTWRLDVAEAVGEVLAASEPPAAVFLKGREGEVGLGLVVAASRANAGCWIETGTTLVAGADDDARELVADAKSIKSQEAKWKKEDERSAFAKWGVLRASLLDPSVGAWMKVGNDGSIAIYPGGPEAPQRSEAARVVTIAEERAKESRLAAADGVLIGLCRGTAADARAASEASLEPLGWKRAEMRERKPVGPSLAELRDSAEELLKKTDKSLDAAEEPLKLQPERRQIAPNKQHAAAASAKPLLDEAAGTISRAEALFQGSPEVLRLPAPGQSDTGQRAQQFESRWRQQLQKLKDRLEKLREKAEKLAKA